MAEEIQLTLIETLLAAGMTPPKSFREGKWLRFPGVGKGRSNRSGWCRVISPSIALYGDFSSGLSAVWKDDAHIDDIESARRLREARARERAFAEAQRRKQEQVAAHAQDLLSAAKVQPHPYLAAKGYGHATGLVIGEHLLIPVRDAYNQRLISLQQINLSGEKRFLHGGRARGGIFRLGNAGRTFLCEGYATGLTLQDACKRLYRAFAVVVCFSAGNLPIVAQAFPDAVVAADNDASGAGEKAARATGLPWIMPPEVGHDFNDWHRAHGLHHVVAALRGAPMS